MLERGRQMLRKRLSSRGLPGVALGTLELGGMSHPVSATLIQTTARAAVTSQGASAAAVAPAEGAIMMMTMAKIKTVCVVAVLVGVVSFGAGWMAVGAGGVEPAKADAKPPAAPEAQAAVQAKKEPGRAVDLYGDPLPEGAVMRLGTVRWRADGVTLGFLPDSRTLIVPASGSEALAFNTGTRSAGLSSAKSPWRRVTFSARRPCRVTVNCSHCPSIYLTK